MVDLGAFEILPKPEKGRVFDSSRRCRLADVDPTGRCRLDALVRYLQDIARDDAAESSIANPNSWVVRRTLVEVRHAPIFEEGVGLATWCSGFGRRWAERRTQLRGNQGAHVEGCTIWVYVDHQTGRPLELPSEFFEIWGPTAGNRRVSARSRLPSSWPAEAHNDPWEVRFCDLDLLGHVNNAAQWVAVEEALDRAGASREPIRAELEHGAGIKRSSELRLRWCETGRGLDTWLTTGDVTGSVARVCTL